MARGGGGATLEACARLEIAGLLAARSPAGAPAEGGPLRLWPLSALPEVTPGTTCRGCSPPAPPPRASPPGTC